VHEEVDDPALLLINQTDHKIVSKIPIIKMRELDTVFSTKEDKIAIIGGLLYSKKKQTESGLPFFAGKQEKLSEKKEIVIAIKAKIAYCPQNPNELVFVE
jgi:type II secretory pathway component GspD/PulD (secretin)